MIIVIGSAESPPMRPTRGEADPPTRNCTTPSSAEADPAVRGWSARASDVAFGMINPTEETMKNSGVSSPGRPRPASTARTAPDALTVTMVRPVRSSVRGAKRPTIRPLTWVMITRPTPFIPNARLYSPGERP